MGWSKHHPTGLIHRSRQDCYEGYTLFANAGGGPEPNEVDRYANLLDMEGRVCHRWESGEGIRYGHLLPNGNLLCRTRPPGEVDGPGHVGGSSAALLELDWDSNVVWEYRNPYLHHDHLRLQNGNTLILLWQRIPADVTARVKGGYVGEEDPKQMFGDVVQEISPDGAVVYEWRSWEHLDFDEDVICPLENREEWTHSNSLSVTSEGDPVISFRKTNTVGIVDRSTGDFKMKWGPGEVSHQHDVSFLSNGHLLIFDNGSHRRGIDFSRVIELDPVSKEVLWEYKGDPPISFYSYHISGAERQPNGNTLICEGSHGRIFEVTPDKEIVWEYINPFFASGNGMGRTNWIFRAHRYSQDHPALQGKDLAPRVWL